MAVVVVVGAFVLVLKDAQVAFQTRRKAVVELGVDSGVSCGLLRTRGRWTMEQQQYATNTCTTHAVNGHQQLQRHGAVGGGRKDLSRANRWKVAECVH